MRVKLKVAIVEAGRTNGPQTGLSRGDIVETEDSTSLSASGT